MKPKIILAQLKMNLTLSIIIIKSHSHTVLMKKQQNFQIHLDLKKTKIETLRSKGTLQKQLAIPHLQLDDAICA